MILKETCPCGSLIEVDDFGAMDKNGLPEATRPVNTWRKFHRCLVGQPPLDTGETGGETSTE
jgi:hypothetical protein